MKAVYYELAGRPVWDGERMTAMGTVLVQPEKGEDLNVVVKFFWYPDDARILVDCLGSKGLRPDETWTYVSDQTAYEIRRWANSGDGLLDTFDSRYREICDDATVAVYS